MLAPRGFIVISVAFLAFCFFQVKGQVYSFRHLTTTQGLPSNKVSSVIQDKTGFMWFGTDKGLARFDGHNVKVYLIPEDSTFYSGGQVIKDVFEDKEGNLWIGTRDRGLMIFDRIRETFTGFLNNPDDQYSLSNNTVNTIYQDREGTLWIGTNGGGINKFDPESRTFISYKQVKESQFALKDQVTVIFEDNSGSFWIGTKDGLYLFDRIKERFIGFDFGVEIPAGEYRQINAIIEDRDGIIWIGTKWGMFKYNKKAPEVVNYLPTDLSGSSVATRDYSKIKLIHVFNMFVISLIHSGQTDDPALWIATKWGLYRLDTCSEKLQGIFSDPSVPDGLSSVQLNEVYLDNQGQFWIATADAGVEKLSVKCNDFNQVILEIPDSEFYYSSSSFLVDRNGILWVGAIDGGVLRYTEDFHNYSIYKKWDFVPDKAYNNRIECLFEDSDDNLWLGYFRWGLILFDREQKEFRQVAMISYKDSPAPVYFDNIIEDKHRMLWVGTDAGLFIKDLDKGALAPANIISHNVLSGARILRIYEDSKSGIWVSTLRNGMFWLSAEGRDLLKFNRWEAKNDNKDIIPRLVVNAFHEDQHETLWLGSGEGLYKINLPDGTFQSDTLFNELHPGAIIQIHGDDHDNLWLFHSLRGLMRYSPYSGLVNNIKVFDTRDGLPFENFNTNFSNINSFYQSPDGRLFISSAIGTGKGFFWFHPDSIKDNLYIPPVAIVSFKVENQDFALDSNITFKRYIRLKYHQNFFTFEFATLDFVIPEKSHYAYYLDGYENDWIYSGTRRFANYTGVPPGNYTFRVKGTNSDGYWNVEGTSVAISILPPPWKTMWAYLSYVIIVIFIFYSIVRYYLRRQQLIHSLELKQVQTEKLEELDKMKSRFFANISHEFRTPLTLIMGPLQGLISKTTDPGSRSDLTLMQRNATRLQRLIDELLSLSKLESGKMKLQAQEENIVTLVRQYIQSFESYARHRQIDLIFTSEEEEIKLYVDKEKIEKVLYNLLSNAFKFTPEGGRVEVAVSSQQSVVGSRKSAVGGQRSAVISITDTGPGIPPEHLPHIFDRFYQADDACSKDQEGTGIGLALTKELVELHHGKIEVASIPGSGTTFRIFLPMGKDHLIEGQIVWGQQSISFSPESEETWVGGETVNAEPETWKPESGTGKPLLLIVEDKPDMRTFIRRYFQDEYQVLEAGNGREGLEKAIEHLPDIVVSDVMMPQMDGYEFCHQVKSDDRTCHIPVILLTARASKESRLEGLETGADDFITKPFDGEELQVRVKNLIWQRRKLSEHYRKAFEPMTGQSAEEPVSRDQKFLKKARNVVEAHLSDPEFGVERFASEMALSRVQLHRKLRALVDQPVTEFIRTIRLNYAITLLQQRAGTISEIAYDAGFNNPTWFTISFKKKFGISPSDYLAQLDKH